MDLVADALEKHHPLFVKIERVPAKPQAASDGGRAEVRPIQLVLANLRVKILALVEQPEQTFVLLGALHEGFNRLEFRRRILGLKRRDNQEDQKEGKSTRSSEHGLSHGSTSNDANRSPH